MKKIIKNCKLIWKIDKKYIKSFLTLMSAIILFPIALSLNTESYLLTLLLAVPIGMIVHQYMYYHKLFIELEKEILLEKKYSFMYNRFIREEL